MESGLKMYAVGGYSFKDNYDGLETTAFVAVIKAHSEEEAFGLEFARLEKKRPDYNHTIVVVEVPHED